MFHDTDIEADNNDVPSLRRQLASAREERDTCFQELFETMRLLEAHLNEKARRLHRVAQLESYVTSLEARMTKAEDDRYRLELALEELRLQTGAPQEST